MATTESTAPASDALARTKPHRNELRGPTGARLAFAALLLLGFVIVLVETRGLSPYADDWDFIIGRRGISLSSLLTPHGPHLSLVPILIYKVWLAVFGASSYLPFRILAGLDMVLLGAVLGWITRRAWGPWWGLAPVLILMTLGPGGVSLLWSFQVGYGIAIATGTTALAIAARSQGGRREALAVCCLLIVSLGSASQGIGFTVGVALLLALRRTPWKEWWPVVIPGAMYVVWYAAYGHQHSESSLSLWPTALPYAANSLSATLPTFFGLSQVTATNLLDTTFGVPLAVAAVGGLVYALWRGWQPPRLVWGLLASALVLWIAAALSNTPGFYRPAQDPRYLETNATIFLAVVALATPRPKLARGGTVASLIVLAVVAATNAKGFGSARTIMNTSDVDSRAEEGAMLIMRNVAASSFSPGFPGDPGGLINITEQEFLNADAKFGSQADTVAQVESAPPTTRDLVDKDLSVGELKLAPGTQTYAERVHSCRTVGSSVLMLRTGPTRLRLTAKQLPMAVYASRFGSPQAFQLGQVQPHATRVLAAPSDGASSVPWRFTLTGTGGRVCTSAPDLGSS